MAANEALNQQLVPLPTNDQYQAQINEALAPLAADLPGTAQFTVASLTAANLTVKDFCSALRALQSFATQGILQRLIAAAATCGVVANLYQITSSELYGVAQWLKSAAGKEYVASISMTRKLERRAQGRAAPADMAWLQIFSIIQAEHSKYAKKIKFKADKEVGKLRQKILEVEQQAAEQLAILASAYPVISKFEEISKPALIEKSWQAYIADCTAKNIVAKEKTQQNMIQAIETFGPVVRSQHSEEFCRRPDVQILLDDFATKKIAGLTGDTTVADRETFRRYLAAATGRQVALTATAPPAPTLAVGAPGHPQPAGDVAALEAAAGHVLQPDLAGNESEGSTASTESYITVGDDGVPRRSKRKKQPAQNA